MQVVIAQHGNGAISQRFYIAQGLQGLRTAVDQIPGEPERIPGRIEFEFIEECAQCVVAALNVTDGIDRHSYC